ncbi:UPF0052-domain-containing protein [Guyanagaster necrorhizus]|uniref:UPF0052-domain-containing protein n=1 Tax=Guyanagaster necrorhizus TaxID=856835 RepID=A0A9P7W017_9AGAR|nr:UPF0052-domain-containing protein [Guyanagaster necrorhizus MCA 3950]KAG7450766.1 UPF0052-domain-containing protein [Guyanagaster necrorhizus MCA 3950]
MYHGNRQSLHLKVQSSGTNSPGSSVFDLPVTASQERYQTSTPASASNTPAASTQDALSTTSFVVISGGTGGNSICSAFGNACYILPVSDNGGSSSEIIRVLGGPSIGDIRSRLIRLIPSAPTSSPLDAIRNLLAYRLPAHYTERQAREEWREIVEGRSLLWQGIPNDRKETIRGFLVYFESELLKRAHKNFNFVNGSIGNYFLAAAQGFFRSLPSAIFLFSSITNSQANILPVVVTNHTVTIAAELDNGERLVGQCEISHPVASVAPSINFTEADSWSPEDGLETQRQNVMFEPQGKDSYKPLASRISKLFYINAYGMEIHPSPNPDYISSLSSHNVLVFSCGSLWTSIIPCLSLRGVATAIAQSRTLKAKILLLNTKNDRETDGYSAEDYILAISRTLNAPYQHRSYGLGSASTIYPVSAFITDLVYLEGTDIHVNIDRITALGVRCSRVRSEAGVTDPKYDAACVRKAIDVILARSE